MTLEVEARMRPAPQSLLSMESRGSSVGPSTSLVESKVSLVETGDSRLIRVAVTTSLALVVSSAAELVD